MTSGTLIAAAIYAATGILAALCGRNARLAGRVGAAGCLAAAVFGLPETFTVLFGEPGWNKTLPWQSVPGATLHFSLDGLAAVFLAPMFLITALVAVACTNYFEEHHGSLAPGTAWLMLNLTAAAMVVVALAQNAILFLAAWEVMAVGGFFLVIYHAEREETRPAGWKWLAASQLGAACILVVFLLLGEPKHSLEFNDFTISGRSSSMISCLFALAVVGFGAKAGLAPFHVWLPEAHPVAPSPVSALLSGVLIKFGIYGFLRVLTFLGTPPAWWGWLLIALGLFSGIGGIANAIVQKDLKRLLAYSSVENIGIVFLGLGLGLYGHHVGRPEMAVLGIGGALLHVWTHAMGKSLLFLGAGAVKHACGTTDIDRLGGLLKKSPILGTTFVVGAASICGLPPLAGFSGEFLIYLAAFEEEATAGGPAALPPLGVLTALALIGGLAVYAFSKAAGLTFLGATRDPSIEMGTVPRTITIPLLILCAFCLFLGFAAPLVVTGLAPALVTVTGLAQETIAFRMSEASAPLTSVALITAVFALLLGGLVYLRAKLLAGREVGAAGTWDCGYAAPAATMQYTGSSYGQSTADLVGAALGYHRETPGELPYFPGPNNSVRTRTEDVADRQGYRPIFLAIAWLLNQGRRLQSGRVHLYVLYIMLTLLAVMIWYAWGRG